MKVNNLKEWARREIDLVTAGEMREAQEMKEELDNHYEAAYQAFCDFVDRTEGLEKPGIAKTIFTQLLHEEPLVPIEDNEEDWVIVEGFDPAAGNENPGWSIYQCKRRSTLFKKVIYERKTEKVKDIRFSDTGRAVCMDINSNQMYTGGMGTAVLDEVIPVTMPYQPMGKIRIFTEDFKFHKDFDGDFDTVGILYFRMADGQMKNVFRFFKEDHESKQMVEITKSEYLSRKKRVEDRMKKASPEVK